MSDRLRAWFVAGVVVLATAIPLAPIAVPTLTARQAPNLEPIVRQVALEHPELLRTNTAATCFRFVQLVLARANDPRWGHVGKTAGEGQYTPPGFMPRDVKGRDGNLYRITGVSHDAIFYHDGPIELQVDLLGGGNDGPDPLGTPAIPQWNVIPQQYYRVNNPWLPAIPIEGGNPAPAPVCPVCKTIPGYAGDEIFDAIALKLFADYAEAGQSPNVGMGRWFGRVTYDWIAGNTKTLDESITKHRKEWREALGLK